MSGPVDPDFIGGTITDPGHPPPGGDPLDPANAANLSAWGLPQRPLDPAGQALWRKMLEGASIERARYVCDPYREIPKRHLPTDGDFRVLAFVFRPTPSRTEQSRNWSGAWIVPRRGQRFVSVWGSWTIPAMDAEAPAGCQPPDTAADGGLPPDQFRCSHWVGIGGDRSYSKSLPQVGTMTAIDWQGVVRHYAWYQWWEPSRKYGPLRITNLDVNAGDQIIAAVTAQNPDTVRLHIRNVTTRQLRSIQWTTDPTVPPTYVDGRSAEWVVERPSWLDSVDQFHFFGLPQFEPATFDGCFAEAAEAIDAPRVARDLTGARLIRMVGRRVGGAGSRLLCVPKKLGPNALQVALPPV